MPIAGQVTRPDDRLCRRQHGIQRLRTRPRPRRHTSREGTTWSGTLRDGRRLRDRGCVGRMDSAYYQLKVWIDATVRDPLGCGAAHGVRTRHRLRAAPTALSCAASADTWVLGAAVPAADDGRRGPIRRRQRHVRRSRSRRAPRDRSRRRLDVARDGSGSSAWCGRADLLQPTVTTMVNPCSYAYLDDNHGAHHGGVETSAPPPPQPPHADRRPRRISSPAWHRQPPPSATTSVP